MHAPLDRQSQVDKVLYTPGAVIWHVDRKGISKSQMTKMIGTPPCKQITVRNVNTMRKLNELTTATAADRIACP